MNEPEPVALGQLTGPRREQPPSAAPGRADPQLSPRMVRSLTRSVARGRLEREVRAIAVDLLGGYQPEELPNDAAEWLATTVEAAVTRVAQLSLAELAETLDARLGSAPAWVARRLREAEDRHDAGYV